MRVAPVPIPTALPRAIVATVGAEHSHVAAAVTSAVDLSEYSATALKETVEPMGAFASAGPTTSSMTTTGSASTAAMATVGFDSFFGGGGGGGSGAAGGGAGWTGTAMGAGA